MRRPVNRHARLQRLWYERRPGWLFALLLPLSALFAILVYVRQLAFRTGVAGAQQLRRPVIVVGNISVGGTGKTPLVIWLAALLQSRGYRVGIVTRGYRGNSRHWPRAVASSTAPLEVGDEPVMLALRTGAIVVAGPDRVAAAALAIDQGADVILSDDGLQHYRLRRDVEIAVIDGHRALGNGMLLPAGPLREPASRLNCVDLIVRTQRASAALAAPSVAAARSVTAKMRLVDAVSLLTGERRGLDVFVGSSVHALAAIGNPQGFFTALREQGIQSTVHALPDHATLTPRDIRFDDDAPVLMTEKDAVKCREFADHRHWAVRTELEFSDADLATVVAVIERSLQRFEIAPH